MRGGAPIRLISAVTHSDDEVIVPDEGVHRLRARGAEIQAVARGDCDCTRIDIDRGMSACR